MCVRACLALYLSGQNRKRCFSFASAASPSVKPSILLSFSLIRMLYYTHQYSTVWKLQTLYPDHRALTLLVDYRSPAMKWSYLSAKSGPWLNVSVALPIVLEKQLGLDFEVKRNSDYADHFTTHCRVIDSPSIGWNLHTSPLIRVCEECNLFWKALCLPGWGNRDTGTKMYRDVKMHVLNLCHTGSQRHVRSVRPAVRARGHTHTHTHTHTHVHTLTCMHTEKGSVMWCAETGCLPSLEAAPHWSCTPCLAYNVAPYGKWKIQAENYKCEIFHADSVTSGRGAFWYEKCASSLRSLWWPAGGDCSGFKQKSDCM